MFAHPTAKFGGKRPGKAYAVAFDHKVYILVGAANQQVAHKAAHGVDGQLELSAQIAREFKNAAGFGQKPAIHQLAHIAWPGILFLQIFKLAGAAGKDIDKVRAGYHAAYRAFFNNGHKALAPRDNDPGQIPDAGAGRKRFHAPFHVFGHNFTAKAVGICPGRCLGIQQAAADACAGFEYGNGLEAEMQHQLISLADCRFRFHANGRR